MNFTGGNKVLVDAETRAKAILAAAPTVASYNTERAAADKELAALAAHAAAGQVAAQLAAIRKLLQDATAAVGLAANNAAGLDHRAHRGAAGARRPRRGEEGRRRPRPDASRRRPQRPSRATSPA